MLISLATLVIVILCCDPIHAVFGSEVYTLCIFNLRNNASLLTVCAISFIEHFEHFVFSMYSIKIFQLLVD